MTTKPLFFVTDRSDSHADRFDALFAGLSERYQRVTVTVGADGGLEATVASQSVRSGEELREALEQRDAVVVSGALDSVSQILAGGDFVHVGISFATDVMVTAAGSEDALRQLARCVVGLDLVVIDNYATENALISLGVDPERIVRIPWGPSSSDVLTTLSREDFGLPVEGPIVLYPRSLEPLYEPEVFVAALTSVATAHPGLCAVFIESGSMLGEVKHLIHEAGLAESVNFQPLHTPEKFGSLLRLADVVVVSPRTDGTSVTVMEAMAAGVPVVSSLTSGSAEWVMDGVTGWTFPTGDVTALANALHRVLSSSDEHRALITGHARTLVAARAGWRHSSEKLSRALAPLLLIKYSDGEPPPEC